jgi:transcriptional regulator with XRE-family HTH domain
MKVKKAASVNQNPEDLIKKIGRKMARLRKEMGYSNADDFSYDKGLNRAQYGKYEAGSQDLRMSTLTTIINKFGLTVEEFFGEGLD